jgi:hypothetical protein
VGFHESKKEILVIACHFDSPGIRHHLGIGRWIRNRAIYLHAVLVARRPIGAFRPEEGIDDEKGDPRYICVLSR